MKCKEIAALIEQLAPVALAYEWDNVGLLCGRHRAGGHKTAAYA